MQPAESYCFCTTRRFVAFLASLLTLAKIFTHSTYQTLAYTKLGALKTTSDTANYSVFMVGQALQVLVTILLLVAIYKENANLMWPYLCWLSLNLLLEAFGCMILIYTNQDLHKVMKELVVYAISLSLSVTLIYITNNYEKELRRREKPPDCSDEEDEEGATSENNETAKEET